MQSQRLVVVGVAFAAVVVFMPRLSDSQFQHMTAPYPLADDVDLTGTYEVEVKRVEAKLVMGGEQKFEERHSDYETMSGTMAITDQEGPLFKGSVVWPDCTEIFTGSVLPDARYGNTSVSRVCFSFEAASLHGHVVLSRGKISIEAMGAGWDEDEHDVGRTEDEFWSVVLTAVRVMELR